MNRLLFAKKVAIATPLFSCLQQLAIFEICSKTLCALLCCCQICQSPIPVSSFKKMDADVKKKVGDVLRHTLKSRISNTLGALIETEIQNQSKHDATSEDIINAVSSNLVSHNSVMSLHHEFMQDIEAVFSSDCTFHEILDTSYFSTEKIASDSLSGSMASLNSSIDFLSSGQMGDLSSQLLSLSPLDKIEALARICSMPNFEHLVNKSIWSGVELGLHSCLLSQISLVRDVCLKVFQKMLYSAEPVIVRESFVSLSSSISNDVFPDFQIEQDNRLCDDFTYQILEILNAFQISVPSKWLRYPHQIMEDVIQSSVGFLNAKNWGKICQIDLKARWLKNFIYGNVSRSMVISAFRDNLHILNSVLVDYKEFLNDLQELNTSNSIEKICCVDLRVKQLVHRLCFMSYFLKHSIGRLLLNELNESWESVLNFVMEFTMKIANTVCFDCFMPLLDTVPEIWESQNLIQLENPKFWAIFSSLSQIVNPTSKMNLNASAFVAQCMSKATLYFTPNTILKELGFELQELMFSITEHFCQLIATLNIWNKQSFVVLNIFLTFFKHLSSVTVLKSGWLTLLTSINQTVSVCHSVVESWLEEEVIDNVKMIENCMNGICEYYLEFIRRPVGVLICLKSGNASDCLKHFIDNVEKISVNAENFSCCNIGSVTALFSYEIGIEIECCRSVIDQLSIVIWKTQLYDSYGNRSKYVEHFIKNVLYSISTKNYWLEPPHHEDVFDNMIRQTLLAQCIKNEDLVISEDDVIFALDILLGLSYNPSAVLILKQRFRIQSLLITKLKDFMSEYDFYVCPISLYLNCLIVKLYFVGGPNEYILPPVTISDSNEDYDWPFTVTYPPSLHYFCVNTTDNVTVNKSDTKIEINETLRYILNDMQFEKSSDLLERCMDAITVDPNLKLSQRHEMKNEKFDDLIKSGMHMTLAYASMSNCNLDLPYDLEKSLTDLLLSSRRLFTSQNDTFDFYVATAFLFFKCDSCKTLEFLEKFALCKGAVYVWQHRGLEICKLDNSLSYSRVYVLELCDSIVQEVLPYVFTSFKMSGNLPSLLFEYWTTQCYWNYLDLTDILAYMGITIYFSGDYSIYFFISILKHLSPSILKHSHTRDIVGFLKENSIVGFNIEAHLTFMNELAKKYDHLFQCTFKE